MRVRKAGGSYRAFLGACPRARSRRTGTRDTGCVGMSSGSARAKSFGKSFRLNTLVSFFHSSTSFLTLRARSSSWRTTSRRNGTDVPNHPGEEMMTG